MTTQWGVLLSSSATRSTKGLFFPRETLVLLIVFDPVLQDLPLGTIKLVSLLSDAILSRITLARVPYLALFLLSLCPVRFTTNRC